MFYLSQLRGSERRSEWFGVRVNRTQNLGGVLLVPVLEAFHLEASMGWCINRQRGVVRAARKQISDMGRVV